MFEREHFLINTANISQPNDNKFTDSAKSLPADAK